MSKRCEQCGAVLYDGDRECPYCGAIIEETQTQPAGTYKVPQTIAELKQFCEERGMPLRKMRFFIGEDFREPRAFGIYQDEDGLFVVYKNKSNGERAIRYRGEDEAFAVHELYEKLKSETELRRNGRGTDVARGMYAGSESASHRQFNGYKRSGRGVAKTLTIAASLLFGKLILDAALLAFILVGARWSTDGIINQYSTRGYYEYNDTAYYHIADDWYYYDTDDYGWYPTESPFSGYDDEYSMAEDAYLGQYYTSDSFYTDWNKSEWYDDYFSSSASSDSDWSSSDYDSWDSSDYDSWSSSDYDSWDSSDTDWDSDW